jgi:perosamine synthetase
VEPIPVSGPWITAKEVAYVTEAVSTAWYAQANKYHDLFEQNFAAYLGVKFAVCLPSCTSAIHLALLALGVGPGDEVIVPDITWIATAAPISYVGATPVCADIDPKTWCLSATALEESITPRTRAVIPVDLYGGMPDWQAIRAVADLYGLAVIEDAAEALGSEYRGRKAGSLGDVGVFSFHGSKTLTTGEGGMLVTDRPEIYERVLFLRDHGRKAGDKMFWNTEVAYKYKMSSMQAALGLAQLERIDELVERKRRIFAWYQEELAGVEGINLNFEAEGTKNTFWMVTAILAEELGLGKERFIELMQEHRVDCRPFFYPLSSLPAYRNVPQALEAQKRNIVSYRISPYGVNLPSGLNLTAAQVRHVSQTLPSLLAGGVPRVPPVHHPTAQLMEGR